MNVAHLHLMLNHLPIVGYVVGVLLLSCAIVSRGDRGMFLASVVVIMFAGAGSLAAYFTGEPAEETVENFSDVPGILIEQHEDAAKVATLIAALFSCLTVVVTLVAFRREGRIPMVAMIVLLLLSLIVSAAMCWVGNLGGQIRHTEIRAPLSTS